MASGSKKVVLAALFGNGTIAAIKFAVAAVTFSSAMLAEAIHSLADTGNQILLLIGLRRSHKPPDELHPFGYGPEQYFWSFVVAIMLFFIGAVVSIYHGISKLQHPEPIESAWLIYIILGVAFLLDGWALSVAYKEFQRSRPPGVGLFEAVKRSKDTNVVVVLLEDSAALIGLVLAFIGVGLADLTGWMVFDALASISIGVLLAAVALLLAREVKHLLIGEAASPANRKAIREVLDGCEEVVAVGQVLTMHLAPHRILVTMDVEFQDGLSTDDLEVAIDQIEAAIMSRVPSVTRIFIEAERVMGSDRAIIRPARTEESPENKS